MHHHFERLYDYNDWANDLFCQKLAEIACKDGEILRLLSHVHNAQTIWLNRIMQVDKTHGVWEIYTLEECIAHIKSSSQAWKLWLKDQKDFDRKVAYKNSIGKSYVMDLADIVIHVANHSTHHRGQIATLLRQQSIDPPKADFYYFALLEE